MNPATCGVAKFNSLLAEKLGIPMIALGDDAIFNYREPMLSLKISEFPPNELEALGARLNQLISQQSSRVFLHAYGDTALERMLLEGASRIYCGNAQLRAEVAAVRPDAVELWCPGTVHEQARFEPADLVVFTFGMAHKVRADYYRKLHVLLRETGKSYKLYMSTALHENTSFDESFSGAFDEIRSAFGPHVHFVGFLSDAAVYNYLLECTYFVAFFEGGVRSNNTSVNSAMASGAAVITNLDAMSPSSLRHLHNVIDIERMDVLPTDAQLLAGIRARAKETAESELGWRSLVATLRTHEVSTNGVVVRSTSV
jgi:hypothetical protein